MLEMFSAGFMQRAWIAGLIVAVICPLIGSFLVLRRQSMIGDGLGHIAFAGVAGGALLGAQPVVSAALATVAGALVIEKVRSRLNTFSEMVLAIFFYSGIGLAVIFSSMNRMGGFNLSSILFGSLMTISTSDLWVVAVLGLFAMVVMSRINYQRLRGASKLLLGFAVFLLVLVIAGRKGEEIIHA